MIAALYVAKGGCYYGLDDVDPWDEERDARLYDGPWPVVAHPPCARWCRLAKQVEQRLGVRVGDDGGVFAAALDAVRRFGGVIEHPAYSIAWKHFGLNAPPATGGWVNADFLGGWTCHVEQWRYGHKARKGTWLYAFGCELPSLRWGYTHDTDAVPEITTTVTTCKRVDGSVKREFSKKSERSATPLPFRDVLLDMARSAL